MDTLEQKQLQKEFNDLESAYDMSIKSNQVLNQQLVIALKALKFISRPWPQHELANLNFDVAKQAIKDILEVK